MNWADMLHNGMKMSSSFGSAYGFDLDLSNLFCRIIMLADHVMNLLWKDLFGFTYIAEWVPYKSDQEWAAGDIL